MFECVYPALLGFGIDMGEEKFSFCTQYLNSILMG